MGEVSSNGPRRRERGSRVRPTGPALPLVLAALCVSVPVDTLWSVISPSLVSATAVLRALAMRGMEHLVVSPGSRSAPLAYAAAAAQASGALSVHVRIDERDAAFTALGLLLAGTARPEATLAVANLVWVLLGTTLLVGAMGALFRHFDPECRMNPGKLVTP